MNKKTIGGIIVLGFILIGIIITAICGLNFDMLYRNHKQVEVYLAQEFNDDEVKEIVKEVVGNKQVVIKTVELYKDMVSIEIEDITSEELNALNTKLNEKYARDNKVEDIIVTDIPKVSAQDIVKPYVLPVVISFVIIEAYLAIYVLIYNKTNSEGENVNIIKAMLEFACGTVMVQLIYFSFLAITRLPINRLTMPIAIILFITTSILKFIDNKK